MSLRTANEVCDFEHIYITYIYATIHVTAMLLSSTCNCQSKNNTILGNLLNLDKE